MTIVGHIFPFYMQFKGGKGFASYLGMMIGIDLKLGLIIVALTIVLSLLSNYVVVGTLIVLIIVPLYFIYIKADISIIMIMIAISALIAYKHRINIRRLIAHEEMGVFDRKKHK